jgi:hypothetical protein
MPYFTDVDYALEEAEYIANRDKVAQAIVDNGEFTFLVMDEDKAKTVCDPMYILEVVRPND